MREAMTRVKICGITNLDDALAAAEAGADLLGFIFYSPSPRFVSPELARKIIDDLRIRSAAPKFVGVFVNESLEVVRQVREQTKIDLVQLHGGEPAAMVKELAPHVYKSIRPRNLTEARANAATYRAALNGNSPAFIIDAFNDKQFGGTGERVDWVIAAKIAREFPILLAGGLNPQNVADAIRTVQPWGVDVSSGVEQAPGVKDHQKLREFIKRAKE